MHIKNEVQNVERGDWIYLHNSLSRKRWAFYFRVNNIDESKFNLTYITGQEILNGEINMKFDVAVLNPPYEGTQQTHQKFFNKAVEIVKDDGVVTSIQPDTAYINKKDWDGKTDLKSNDKMKDNIKKYKTSVEFVEGTIFDGADVATGLAKTTLTKTLDKIIEVKYLSGDKYSHIDLEDINKLGVEPTLYKSVTQKIETYIAKHGSMHDITYYEKKDSNGNRIPANVYKISMIRGNRGTDDFYTIVTRDKDKHKVEESLFGFEIKPEQEKFMYSYLTSFLARFALSIYKTNTNAHRGEMRIIPLMSFDRIWTDEMIAKEWGVTNTELDTIKKILPNYYNI